MTSKLGLCRLTASVFATVAGLSVASQTLGDTKHATCGADKSTFKAWVDEMPGKSHEIIVAGKVSCPTTGFKVDLVKAIPQGINPHILILDLKITAPSGTVGQVVTPHEVRFEEANGSRYSGVTIRGGGPEFLVDVGIVH